MIKNILKIGGVKWTHLSKPKDNELQDLIEDLDLHEMVEQDILESSAQDKIDTYDDCVFLIIHFPKYNEKL
jgi:magnesium transporter